MEPIRIQKYLSDCGVLSRRAAEQAIIEGDVRVDGLLATLGMKIVPGDVKVEYRGKVVTPRKDAYTYLLLNKPRGIVTTASDEKGRRTVTDLVKSTGKRLYPVGRLDCDSDGLLILTDDGAFTQSMTHPRHHVEKVYDVKTREPITDKELSILTGPITLDGYLLQPVEIQKTGERTMRIVLREGRNRQIRRMCEMAHLTVDRLTRIAIGPIELKDLKTGLWRPLSAEELQALRAQF